MSDRGDEARFTYPDTAVDHVRRVAREAAEQSGYRAAAFAVMELRREYRIMPLKQKEAPPVRDLASEIEAVRHANPHVEVLGVVPFDFNRQATGSCATRWRTSRRCSMVPPRCSSTRRVR